MFYYCKHYQEQINKGKAIKYCLRQDCWAFKIFRNKREFNNWKNKTCKSLKNGL